MTSAKPVPRWLLLAGLAAGILAAAGGLLSRGDSDLPEGAVARVGDRLIGRDAWLRAVAAVASERSTPLSDEDQRRILDRLVDEELLVQHGLDLGLVERDRRLRGQLVNEVLMSTRAQAAVAEVDEPELRNFYQAHADWFRQPGHLQVAAYRVDSEAQALALAARLRDGEAIAPSWRPPLPDTRLPLSELRTYLGPTLAEAARALAAGMVSAPLAVDGGYALLQVRVRDTDELPPFEAIREQVQREWQRRADERAVADLLRELRQDRAVVVRQPLP